MQAAFAAYSQATKHHSLVLSALRKEVDELKLSSQMKDTIISELKETNFKMAGEIEELKRNQRDRLSILSTIEQLEQRMNEMQEKNGKYTAVLIISNFSGNRHPSRIHSLSSWCIPDYWSFKQAYVFF